MISQFSERNADTGIHSSFGWSSILYASRNVCCACCCGKTFFSKHGPVGKTLARTKHEQKEEKKLSTWKQSQYFVKDCSGDTTYEIGKIYIHLKFAIFIWFYIENYHLPDLPWAQHQDSLCRRKDMRKFIWTKIERDSKYMRSDHATENASVCRSMDLSKVRCEILQIWARKFSFSRITSEIAALRAKTNTVPIIRWRKINSELNWVAVDVVTINGTCFHLNHRLLQTHVYNSFVELNLNVWIACWKR